MLQRSRTRWSAESTQSRQPDLRASRASTEPHSLECGEETHETFLLILHQASTEPHSLECGEETHETFLQILHQASTEPHSLECGECRPLVLAKSSFPAALGERLVNNKADDGDGMKENRAKALVFNTRALRASCDATEPLAVSTGVMSKIKNGRDVFYTT